MTRQYRIERIWVDENGTKRDFSGFITEAEPLSLPFNLTLDGLASLLDVQQLDNTIKARVRKAKGNYYARSEKPFESDVFKSRDRGVHSTPFPVCTYAVQIYRSPQDKTK